MMSKEETIGTIENAKHFTYGDEKFNEAFDSAINYLKETMWVPVTERLPEKEGAYIVTVRDIWGNGYVTREWFFGNEWSYSYVVAWMYVKPYEGE